MLGVDEVSRGGSVTVRSAGGAGGLAAQVAALLTGVSTEGSRQGCRALAPWRSGDATPEAWPRRRSVSHRALHSHPVPPPRRSPPPAAGLGCPWPCSRHSHSSPALWQRDPSGWAWIQALSGARAARGAPRHHDGQGGDPHDCADAGEGGERRGSPRQSWACPGAVRRRGSRPPGPTPPLWTTPGMLLQPPVKRSSLGVAGSGGQQGVARSSGLVQRSQAVAHPGAGPGASLTAIGAS